MQETQILLAQIQVALAQLSLQVVAVPALGLVWLLCLAHWVPAINPGWVVWRAWLGLFERLVHLAVLFGLLWVVIMALAWPTLLARVGSVLGPLLALSVAIPVVVGVTAWRGLNASIDWLRGISVLIVALTYTSVMILLVVAQSWMRSPDGTTLIDGRFQVLDWGDVMLNRHFAIQMALTALGAVTTGIPIALSRAFSEPENRVQRQRQALAATGVLACIGMLILLEPVVLWWSEGLLGMSGLILGESPDVTPLWVGRSVLVALLITLLAFLTIMLCDSPLRGKRRIYQWLTWLSWPLWLAIWWLMHASLQGAVVAGLPAVDVMSTSTDTTLAIGVVGVAFFCFGSLWFFWRLCLRDRSITTGVVA